MTKFIDTPHPGERIKAEVIPKGMAVTEAAQLIGVSRPTLSKLLNGKASLSAEMALRLEKAFNFPSKNLMDMQAQYEAAQATQRSAPANTLYYVPPFLAIKANDIERWASDNIQARSRLSVFLRMLVNSTGSGLTKVSFPGNDDAERPGWDGFVEAHEGTPWIPAGRSGWEFGTNSDIRTKANNDFKKSVAAIEDNEERAKITFVFVTPRRWPGKATWISEQQSKGRWKDVRAYDASDLEQWLEQSLPAQAWLSNETLVPAQDVRSLDKCWADWANVSEPPLTGALFGSAIEAAKRTILSRLSRPSNKPTVIMADSTGEALAFVAQLLSESGGEELATYRDRVLVFDKPGALPRLASGSQSFIPVVYTREVELELAPFANSINSIVIYPRNAANAEPHIVLEPTPYNTFNNALEQMGKNRDEISQLTNESGRSLTVLRRRLATSSVVRTPEWAATPNIAASLVPFMLVGAWHSENITDRAGLELLSAEGSTYDELERTCQRLTQLNDAPVWSIGNYRGVVSKIDLLYAIAGVVTVVDLKRFFDIARMVLGEDDPALDLAEDQRWAATIHGKTRDFSGAFRKGISETLVLLAVHGGQLFKTRLGIDTELEARSVVHDLLSQEGALTTRILEANDQDLPTYAEAAPNEFLSILERDLKTDSPAVLGLLRPADSSILGVSPSRTGLLWALEGLAWNPQTLTRAVLILARLAQIEINDNWVNKPTHSLESIFRAWMPQTAASCEARVDLMKQLAKKFPDVAWKLCVGQFGHYHQVGDYTHKPSWRPDGYGFGEPLQKNEQITPFIHEMVEMALTWENYSPVMLGDLVQRLHALSVEDQSRAWGLIEIWAKNKASDSDKATLREIIRVKVLLRHAMGHAMNGEEEGSLLTDAKAAYDALEPSDLLNKHAWLFRGGWVEESADELDDLDNSDFDKREERIKQRRLSALYEIHDQMGLTGILDITRRGNASWVIGSLSAGDVLTKNELCQLLRLAFCSILAGQDEAHEYKNLITGAVNVFIDDPDYESLLNDLMTGLAEEDAARMLMLAPFGARVWSLVDKLGSAAQDRYWSEVIPNRIYNSDSENNEGIGRLMRAGRPRAAFACLQHHPEKIDALVLFRLLSEMALEGKDKPGQYMFDQYSIEKAFKYLDSSSMLTLDQKAGLEFKYLKILAVRWDTHNTYGIPNLERYVESHPEFFVQAIVWTYKRKDDAVDPDEFQIPPDQAVLMGERGYSLLEAIKRIPGHNDLDEMETKRLLKWITTVRNSCANLARAHVADISIGHLLSHAPVGKDGVWPNEAVRDAMEMIQSEDIMRGMQTGVYNSRGVHMRGEDGDSERKLAERYRRWGHALQSSHPFVASKLLFELSNTYDREASREDTEAGIRRRLR